jgi:hypothetical protein
MGCTNWIEKFQELIKNPIYKDFNGYMGKLYSIKKDKGYHDRRII